MTDERFEHDFSYTPQHVANYFLERADRDGVPITQMKLIKLVYIAFGWTLALLDWEIFDEDIEAWQHGPVIPSIYHEFKKFGRDPITERATDFDLDTFDEFEPSIPVEDEETAVILDRVWSSYKSFSGSALRNKTHAVGTPWYNTYNPTSRNAVIPNDQIKEHFRGKIAEYLK